LFRVSIEASFSLSLADFLSNQHTSIATDREKIGNWIFLFFKRDNSFRLFNYHQHDRSQANHEATAIAQISSAPQKIDWPDLYNALDNALIVWVPLPSIL
jgi:hypothetical protein